MKLMYGTAQYIDHNSSVFNFNSLIEGYPSSGLIPPNNLGAVNEYDFDMRYMKWIIGYDNIFINFMNIIMEIYYGRNVYLIINLDEWGIIMIESLLKLIQQRYGINGTFINDYEDIKYAEESQFDPYYGLANFDQDKERYIYLYEQTKLIRNGGKVPTEDY